ncbi:MAG: hypothetical protein A2X19_10065 [Bacteroidetes bacterium GWE2_39_28]|nr:MAG: hypothetical protein A2X19_10065 [Bacteroidetes bacterium GWE2_39_28]OFY15989.1 MAG: hypothetical protein A2X16_01110 [Bacteroidetes bacterium GWF2_39_10]OFZ07805.1 MAG: hypothetical protein A2322_02775 [Bacteroidetes bacterium RIFOXYB2_FULL_39_7]OFZ10936.1 MAG: hypothetical protein A2465_00985 [Bacteroidetes bacterium RIFOXYC2_FULL_39_11]HCT95245.1 hypothetical protein [Rikenellaceae bacterium]
MKKFILASLLYLFLSTLFAQTGEDYKKFIENAEGYSNLYRGTAPLAYKFTHTGTYFAYSPDFQIGTVRYNSKIYTNLMLNLNSHLDELYLFISYSGRYVVLNNDFVESFTMGTKEFHNITLQKGDNTPGLSPGYYEVLYKNDSAKLYKKIKKTYAERINQSASSETNSKLERMFLATNTYHLVKGEKVYGVKRVGDIIRIYPAKRKEIRHLIREKNLDARSNRDNSFAEIIKFVESTSPNTIK